MINKYAKINSENIVENVIVCDDLQINSQNGLHIKCTNLTRDAHIGSSYDLENNKFIDSKPYESWILNEETFEWESPSGPKPGENYFWLESEMNWKVLGQ